MQGRQKLIIGTRNKNKFNEIKSILLQSPEIHKVNIVSLNDLYNIPEIIEDGKTIQENAIKKALFLCKKTNCIVLSDDTGIEVEYLNGAPGVYSARFAGEKCSYSDNNKKLLELLKNVSFEKRKARFVCAIVLAKSEQDFFLVEESVEGYITEEERGKNGFGYDPVFLLPEYNKTFAEMPSELKNKISHRAKAVNKIKSVLLEILNKI